MYKKITETISLARYSKISHILGSVAASKSRCFSFLQYSLRLVKKYFSTPLAFGCFWAWTLNGNGLKRVAAMLCLHSIECIGLANRRWFALLLWGVTLRRLINYMRASMGKDRLSHLALLHIHYPTPVDLDTVVDCYARLQPRRLQLENLLQ